MMGKIEREKDASNQSNNEMHQDVNLPEPMNEL